MNNFLLPESVVKRLDQIIGNLTLQFPMKELLAETYSAASSGTCRGCSGTCEGSCRGNCDGLCLVMQQSAPKTELKTALEERFKHTSV